VKLVKLVKLEQQRTFSCAAAGKELLYAKHGLASIDSW